MHFEQHMPFPALVQMNKGGHGHEQHMPFPALAQMNKGGHGHSLAAGHEGAPWEEDLQT